MKNYTMLMTGMIFLIAMTALGAPQVANNANKNVIKGIVLDKQMKTPVEYANIILLKQQDSSQVTGTITNKKGEFLLDDIKPGLYHLQVKFIGYYRNDIENISIKANAGVNDLGTLYLNQAILMMSGVEVETDKPPVEYKIDRKVINVAQQLTATSGTAVDVLENVPSVTVDIDGNVQLRGSSSFTVLIDNRPTVMDPNDVLQQIPSSTIENIEIITNPSAKYKPDGMSGIINIITKKNKLQGFSGIVNLNGGLDEKYGSDFLLNYRTGIVNAYFGANFNKRKFPGNRESRNETFLQDTTSYLYSKGENDRKMEFYGINSGVDLALTSNDNMSIGVRYSDRNFSGNSLSTFDEWRVPGTIHSIYSNKSTSERGGNSYSINMDYQHRFQTRGHELSGQFNYGKEDGDELSINKSYDDNKVAVNGQKNIENGPGNEIEARIDYVLPLSETNKFEAGYEGRYDKSTEGSEMYNYVPAVADFVFQADQSHSIDYFRDITALYTMYSGEIGSIGYQGGLRGEYTNRSVELVGENVKYAINRWDYFPTLHMSYQHSSGNQFMASYTRRIERPRGYFLEPFETWEDAYNVRRGNPDVKPEYIDSYELGYQKHVGKNLFSLESYYRVTNDKIERVESVYADNIMLHSVGNVGKDYTFGMEFMFNWDFMKWWNVNFMGNMYDYRIEGNLLGEDYSQHSFNWTSRVNNTFMISETTKLQFNVMYDSPTVESQGREEGHISTNFAFRQELMDNKMALTLQARDLFGTEKHESISEGTGFYRYSKFSRKSPMVTLTLSLKLNNYKSKDGNGMGSQGVDDGSQEF